MGNKRVTIQDVASAAGVSITTVSRYLNQRYDSMSAATKDRIAEVVARLNYKPNVLAQGLKGNKTKTIAIVVVNIGYPFCVAIIRSLSEVLSDAGYRLIVSDTGGKGDRERSLLESLMAQQVEGVIIQTNGDNNDLLAEMAEQIPVVIVDRQFNIPHTMNVVTNNEDASYELSDALFRSGYKDVIYLTEPIAGISTREGRLAGYEAACADHHRASFVVWVNKDDAQTFQEAILTIGSLDIQKPAAIYTANGLIMLPFYPLVRDAGLKIPEEFGLATFDEPDWVLLTTPPLICVRQPTSEIGQYCGEAILKALRRHKTWQKQQVKVFPSEVSLSIIPSPDREL